MTMPEQKTEDQLQAQGLTAPCITPEQVTGKIVSEAFYVFPGTTLTVCALTLENGFVVTGMSAAVSPENFHEQVGRDIAYAEARDKIWELEGYLLRERLHHG